LSEASFSTFRYRPFDFSKKNAALIFCFFCIKAKEKDCCNQGKRKGIWNEAKRKRQLQSKQKTKRIKP